MTDLYDVMRAHVGSGSLPGAVGLVARGDRLEVTAVGTHEVGGGAPMRRDSIFRIASITKPVIAALTMMLADDGKLALSDPISRWLPELAAPMVVRTPRSPVDDVVPAHRPITVFDLLTFRAGWGFGDDFTAPALAPLFAIQTGALHGSLPAPDAWVDALSRVPMLRQPGESWLYNTGSDILGVLIARLCGQPLPEVLAEHLFEPLGMADTAFEVPPGKLDRFTTLYKPGADGRPELVDPPDGEWSTPAVFPSGSGGLVSTVDDWHAFGRMLLAGGFAGDRQILGAAAIRQMTTDHLTPAQRDASRLFLEGQGWGFGGSVDVSPIDVWNSPGRYGWVGGTGTSAHIVPTTGTVAIMMSQMEMISPSPPALMRDFWLYAAGNR